MSVTKFQNPEIHALGLSMRLQKLTIHNHRLAAQVKSLESQGYSARARARNAEVKINQLLKQLRAAFTKNAQELEQARDAAEKRAAEAEAKANKLQQVLRDITYQLRALAISAEQGQWNEPKHQELFAPSGVEADTRQFPEREPLLVFQDARQTTASSPKTGGVGSGLYEPGCDKFVDDKEHPFLRADRRILTATGSGGSTVKEKHTARVKKWTTALSPSRLLDKPMYLGKDHSSAHERVPFSTSSQEPNASVKEDNKDDKDAGDKIHFVFKGLHLREGEAEDKGFSFEARTSKDPNNTLKGGSLCPQGNCAEEGN